jgi:2-methylcitrate dehydratase PrpD
MLPLRPGEDDAVSEAEGISARLCTYAGSLAFEAIPEGVVDRVKVHFLDFLAVAFGGRCFIESSPVFLRAIRKVAGRGGRSSVFGENDPAPVQHAAFLNAAFAHSMDFDDTHQRAVMHPGVTIFPTLLALAEDRGSSGADFIAAATVGYDVANKLGKAHGQAVHHRGFHPTATTGIFGSTLAGARLLRMPHEQTLNAFGLNVSQSAGSHQFHFNGAWDKRAHTGFAAQQAVMSLLLAEEGYRGSRQPIEGEWGYFALFAEGGVDERLAVEGLGSEFEIMQTGIKPYPACRCSHSTIDVVRRIAIAEALQPGDVARIDILLGPFSSDLVAEPEDRKRAIETLVDAQFSVYFAAAVALQGDLTWPSYARHMQDGATRDLMSRVYARPDASLTQYGTQVLITLRDGRSFEGAAENPRGEPDDPLSFKDVSVKFRSLAEAAIGRDRSRELIGLVRELDSLGDLRVLGQQLRQVAAS